MRGDAVRVVYASGTVEPEVMLPISPKVTGRLGKLMVHEDQQVTKGQVLAQLDSGEFDATVREWEARVAFAETQYKRAEELFQRGVASGVSRDNARNEMETARASLNRVKQQQGEMALRAPADGVVIRRDGEVGQLIQTGQAVYWLSCCAPLRVTADVDEEDVPRVKSGQRVLIRADAFPDDVLEGRIDSVTPKGDPIARTFRARIAMPADTKLRIGMTVVTNIVVDERKNALLIPTDAVKDGSVWLVKNGALSRQPVKIGISGPERVEILSGLDDADVIVIHPSDRLSVGRSVKVRDSGS